MNGKLFYGFGLLGYILFFVLFYQIDPATRYSVEINRAEISEAARNVTNGLGYSADDWNVEAVSASNQGREAYYLRSKSLQPEIKQMLTAAEVQVLLNRDGIEIETSWTLDGRLLSVEHDLSGRESEENTPQERMALIRRHFELISADSAEEFEFVEEGEITREWDEVLTEIEPGEYDFSQAGQPDEGEERERPERVLKWSSPGLSTDEMTPELQIVTRADQVIRARLEPNFNEEFASAYSDRDDLFEAWTVVAVLVATLIVLLGVPLFFFSWMRRTAGDHMVLSAFVFLGLLQVIYFLFGGGWDEAIFDNDGFIEGLIGQLAFLVFVMLPVVTGLWGAGYSLALRSSPEKEITTDLFLKWKWRLQPVGQSILAGLASAGTFLSFPYLAALVWRSGGESLALPDYDAWFALLPVAGAISMFSALGIFWLGVIFAFLYPACRAIRRGKRVCQWATWVLAASGLTWFFTDTIPVALTASVPMIFFADWLYRRRDLLSVLTVGFAVPVLITGAGLLVQNDQVLRMQGLVVLALLAGVAVAASWVARRGEPFSIPSEAKLRLSRVRRATRLLRAERERLLAEFSVAREAQDRMLPDAAPEIPGFQLSARCLPAREVGGDLYDFIPLEGGRWLITVADVSGKGVAASLYMTLTKGLIESLARQVGAPHKILDGVNRHFFNWARRSVFVTLIMAVLDGSDSRVTCSRAGHTPLIVRKSRSGEALTVQPPGIGIGLVSGELFSRSLAVEEIDIEEGDTLFLYSDGLTEAMNQDSEEFGEERLRRAIKETEGLDAKEARDYVIAQIEEFVGERPPADDMTLVVIQRHTGLPV